MKVFKRTSQLFEYLLTGNVQAILNSLHREWVNYQFWRGRPFVYRKGIARFVCFPDWIDSRYLHSWSGDLLEIQMLSYWLKENDTFVDVGANLGLYALTAAALLSKSGKVFAFEANEFAVTQLHRAIAILGVTNVTVAHTAISDRNEQMTLWVTHNGQNTFESSLSSQWADKHKGAKDVPTWADVRPRSDKLQPQLVDAITLTSFSATASDALVPTAVKLDIEGAEVMALSGTPSTWLNGSTLWIVEINPTSLRDFSQHPSDLLQYFPSDIFERWIIPPVGAGGDGRPRRLADTENFEDSSYYNLLAIPRTSERCHRLIAYLENISRVQNAFSEGAKTL